MMLSETKGTPEGKNRVKVATATTIAPGTQALVSGDRLPQRYDDLGKNSFTGR